MDKKTTSEPFNVLVSLYIALGEKKQHHERISSYQRFHEKTQNSNFQEKPVVSAFSGVQ